MIKTDYIDTRWLQELYEKKMLNEEGIELYAERLYNEAKLPKAPIDLREQESKLIIPINMGLNIEAGITFGFDGDCILFVSLMDGKNVGWLNVSKKDEQKLKDWMESGD